MPITQSLTAPGTAPARTQTPAVYIANADALVAWLATHVTEMGTWTTQANAMAAALNSIAAGTAMSAPYTFSTTTADADPGAGFLRLDNATQNAATTIRADLAGSDGSDWSAMLATLDDSTSTIKGHILLQALADGTKWLLFSVSALASPSGYKNITVSCVASSAASPFANNDAIVLKFTRTGDKGDTGAKAGLSYAFSTDTAATDPTAGVLKFNDATLASATALYISETDADANALAALLATWDDATTTNKGRLRVEHATDQTKWAEYYITGTLTDNGGWDTFTVAYIAGGGTLSNADPLAVTFAATGNDGADGASPVYRSARTSNTILAAADTGKLIDITSGTFTQTFSACATLGDGWYCYLRNSGTGDVTLDPDGAEQIDGMTSYIMYPGETRLVQCDGSALRSIVLTPFYLTATASITFTKPPGYQSFGCKMWAGGGSGRLDSAGTDIYGGGGGACCAFEVPASEVGATETITIGAGGVARVATANGAAGGNTTAFGVTAYGGAGGTATTGYGGSAYHASVTLAQSNVIGYGDPGQTYATEYGGASASAVSATFGPTIHGGAAGDSVYNAVTVISSSTASSKFGGNGGVLAAVNSYGDGTAPGGGGSASKGTQSGAGARGEARIWGVA